MKVLLTGSVGIILPPLSETNPSVAHKVNIEGTGLSVTNWIDRDFLIPYVQSASRNNEFAIRYRIGSNFYIKTLGGD